MFTWKEFQLYGVLGTAMAVIALGLFLIRRKQIPVRQTGKPLELESLKWDPNRLKGALMLGAGWALTGTCPGTALTQIGGRQSGRPFHRGRNPHGSLDL